MAEAMFAAGLVEQLVYNSQLTGVENCFHGAEQVTADAHALLIAYENGNKVSMARLALKLRTELKDGLAYCEQAIPEDLHSVITWAHIFGDPQEMTDVLAKNVLLHALGIKNHIEAAKSDWTDGEYFKAGQDTAMVFDLAFGWPQPAVADQLDALMQ